MATISEPQLACRACEKRNLELILSLGRTSLADRLLTADQLRGPEIKVPLDLALCPDCSLVQITETVSPEILFREDYPYFSSVSRTVLQNARENAAELGWTRNLDANSLVVEPASNDGYMLKNFIEKRIPMILRVAI